MATIPKKATDPVTEAIDAYHAANQDSGHRRHLGASIIGRPCERALFYTFRWCTDTKHTGRLLRLFRRGQMEEETFVADLKAIGVDVLDVDPSTGEQFRVSAHNGHFGGSLDGLAINVPGAPKTPHVVEFKTHGDKSFKTLKDGVQKAKPEHYAQMQIYMHLRGMKRALYIAVNKNDDALYTERVKYDKAAAVEQLEKAERIITTDRPPVGISKDPSYYLCKWCDHNAVCHESAMPAVNCRTCVFAKPNDAGKWDCQLHGEATATCEDHLYNPFLVPYEHVAASDAEHWIEYKRGDGTTFRNGRTFYSSAELKLLPEGDAGIDLIKEAFPTATVTDIERPASELFA